MCVGAWGWGAVLLTDQNHLDLQKVIHCSGGTLTFLANDKCENLDLKHCK